MDWCKIKSVQEPLEVGTVVGRNVTAYSKNLQFLPKPQKTRSVGRPLDADNDEESDDLDGNREDIPNYH